MPQLRPNRLKLGVAFRYVSTLSLEFGGSRSVRFSCPIEGEARWRMARMKIFLYVLLARSVFGQAHVDTLRFEVASIRPSRGPSLSRMGCIGNRFVFTGFALTWLIRWAYGLPPTRIQGLPTWVTDWVNKTDSMYEIEARAPMAVNKAQCEEMARLLLADRFRMVAHLEPREIRVYALTVRKKGIKMHQVSPNATGAGVRTNRIPFRIMPTDPLMGKPIVPPGISMSQFAEQLSSVPLIGQPVIDKTGLKGIYSFDLNFSSREDDGLPTIWTAVQEQLGLKFEPAKAVMDVLVVAHIERPGPN